MDLNRQLDALRSVIESLTNDTTLQQQTIQSLQQKLHETLHDQHTADQQRQESEQLLIQAQEENQRLVGEMSRLISTELAQRLLQVRKWVGTRSGCVFECVMTLL